MKEGASLRNSVKCAEDEQQDGLNTYMEEGFRNITDSEYVGGGFNMTMVEINSLLQECIDKGYKPYAIVTTEKGCNELRKLIVEEHYKFFQSGVGADLPEYVIKSIVEWCSPHGLVKLLVDATMEDKEVIVVNRVCSQTEDINVSSAS